MKNGMKKALTDDLKSIGNIIEDAEVCMMSTFDQNTFVCTRPMTVLEIDEAGTVWFFTSTTSHLIEEVRRYPHIHVTFTSGKDKFLSATGTSAEVFDRQKIKELWNPFMKAWFKEGLESSDLVLLKVDLENVEYWDSPSSPVVKVAGLLKAMVSKKPFTQGHHDKVNLHH